MTPERNAGPAGHDGPTGRDGAAGDARTDRAFEFVEGATSDIAFRARGASVEEALAAAAEALLAATVEDPGTVADTERRRLVLEEPDLDLLLLRFLNELVYLRDAEGLLMRAGSLRVTRPNGPRLEGELCGEPIDPDRHALWAEVKAATAHDLGLHPREAGGWEARATLDV